MCSKLPPSTAIHLRSRLRKLPTMVAHCSTVISSQAWVNAIFSCPTVAYRVAETFSSRMVHTSSPSGWDPASWGAKHPCLKSRETSLRRRRLSSWPNAGAQSCWSANSSRPKCWDAEDSLLMIAAGGNDFDISFEEDQRRLHVAQIPAQAMTEAGKWMLAFFEQLSAILTIVERLNGQNPSVRPSSHT